MRIVVMGTGPFAVPMFHALLEGPHPLVGLVTRPSRPARKRGRQLPEPMREAGHAAGLRILDPHDVNSPESQQKLEQLEPQLLVVCDYGQILSRETLAIASLGGINLHGSLLPRYRGAAPVQWALIEGESTTGVSVIHMTPRLDAGPILAARETAIEENENAGELEHRLAQLGVEPLLEAVNLLADWDGNSELGTLQQEELASPARRLTKSDGEVDWTLPARQLCQRIRGLQPWPGCYTIWERTGKPPLRLILEEAEAQPLATSDERAPAGTVLHSGDGQLLVLTGDGLLSITQIQPAGKRRVRVDEFLRGYPIAAGDQLGHQGRLG